MAKQLARYAVEQITDDGVPVWDYSLPADEIQYKDSSAGAITAAGLLLIAQCIEDEQEAEQYRKWGLYLLQGLMDSCDLTQDDNALGLLAHGASFCQSWSLRQHAAIRRLLLLRGTDACQWLSEVLLVIH